LILAQISRRALGDLQSEQQGDRPERQFGGEQGDSEGDDAGALFLHQSKGDRDADPGAHESERNGPYGQSPQWSERAR